MTSRLWVLGQVVTALLVTHTASAQRGVEVLTMGPGDPTFSKFGHNAIVVRGPGVGPPRVYNYGTFTFADPNIVSHFLHKQLKYWLSVSSLDGTIESYIDQNRTLSVQELALDGDQSRALAHALAVNALPENRFYAYDYYTDNCSTRVRDALDRVLGGALHRAAGRHASLSYRDHTLRLVSDRLPLYVALDFGLSGYADRPRSEWDELFLPEKLANLLGRVRVQDSSGRDAPLVTAERVLFAARRAPLPQAPPRRTVAFVATGIAIAAAFAALSLARRRRWAGAVLGTVLAVTGIGLGAFGALLAFFWIATEHRSAWANLNLLFAPPWLVLCAIAGPAFAIGRRWGALALRCVIVATAASSLVGLALLPFVAQHSERIAGLFAPVWIALGALEVVSMRRRT